MIGTGIKRLLEQAKQLAPQARILLVSPIWLGEDVFKEEFDPEFSRESVEVSKALAAEYQEIARAYDCDFLDASTVARPGMADREHMDIEGHRKFAEAIYKILQ